MALLHLNFRILFRRRLYSLLLTLLLALLYFSSFYLSGLKAAQESAIEDMVTETDIHCVVTDAQGLSSTDLSMNGALVGYLLGWERSYGYLLDDYVKDVHAMGREQLKTPEGFEIHRILDFASDPSLSAASGAEIILEAGVDESIFRKREAVCLIPEDYPADYEEDGSSYLLLEHASGIAREVKVVGRVRSKASHIFYVPLFFPWEEETSVGFQVDRCSFAIRDNRKLEEAKNELYRLFVKPSRLNKETTTSFGLIVEDETYQKNLKELRGNLRLLEILLPLLMVLAAGIGFLTASLSIRGQIKEIGIQICMGLSIQRIVFLSILQQLALVLAGFAAGYIIKAIILWELSLAQADKALLLSVLFLCGTGIALLRINHINHMSLMKREE